MKFTFLKNKKLKSLVLGVVVFVLISTVVFVFIPFKVQADLDDSLLGFPNVILGAIGVLNPLALKLQVVAGILGSLFAGFTGILVWVIQWDNFIDSPSVVVGWEVVRDICNMFFVLIFLVIAFATILKIESYQWKKLLPKLIIMAILINFSKLITGIIIDISQIVMRTFVNAYVDSVGYWIVDNLGMIHVFNFVEKIEDLYKLKLIWGDITKSLVYGNIYIAISLVVVGVFVLILIFRVIGLWILTILSPLAFLLSVFPGTQKYFQQWWTKLVHYAIVGPVIAFFLWLSLTIAQGVNSDSMFMAPSDVSEDDIEKTTTYVTPTQAGSQMNLSKFIVTVGLMLGGLIASSQMGVAGGKMAGSALTKLQSAGMAPLKAGKFVGGWAVEVGAAKMGIPRWEVIKEGWKAGVAKRREKRENSIREIENERRGGALPILAALSNPKYAFEEYGNIQTLFDVFNKGHIIKGLKRVGGLEWKEERKKAKAKEDRKAALTEELLMGGDKGEELRREMRNKIHTNIQMAKGKRNEVKEAKKGLKNNNETILNKQNTLEDEAKKLDEKALKETGDRQIKLQQEAKNKREKIVEMEKEKVKNENDEKKKIDNLEKEENKYIRKFKGYRSSYKNIMGRTGGWQKAAEDKIEHEIKVKMKNLNSLGKVGGYITGAQAENRKKNSEAIAKRMLKVLEDINNKKDEIEKNGMSQGKNKSAIDLEIANDSLVGKNGKWTQTYEKMKEEKEELRGQAINHRGATKGEAEFNKKLEDGMKKEIENLNKKLKAPTLSAAEKEEKINEIKAAEQKAKEHWKKADAARPSVDYSLRRDQRVAINEEKSKLTTDSWMELHSMFEDALKKKDLNRAAATFLKATESGNDNEFLNESGYKSNDMKKFMDEKFKVDLGASDELVKAIANDVSYAAEKVNHWGLARSVYVRHGEQMWAPEEERLTEVLAEVRKTDFESFMRRSNRLAYGGEEVVDPENYGGGMGNRQFQIDDFGLTYYLENWKKLRPLFDRGRVNINLAVKFTEDQNFQKLMSLQKLVDSGDRKLYIETLNKLKYWGRTGEGEFGYLGDVMNMRKFGQLG